MTQRLIAQRLTALTALFAATATMSANSVTRGTWAVYQGATQIAAGLSNEQACVDVIVNRTDPSPTAYTCRESISAVPASAPPAPAPPPVGARMSYQTSFAAAEYPVSEGGKWWKSNNPWHYVLTQEGFAQASNHNQSYDDSYAYLLGQWGPDQTVEATLNRGGSATNDATHEALLLLRVSDDTNNVRGYECLFSHYGGIDLLKWTGPLGGFQHLDLTYSGYFGREFATGDVLKCSVVGTRITAYVNGTRYMEATDSAITSGAPGVGFFTRPGGNLKSMRFTDLKATSN
jgi:hypothetical protein